LARDVVQKILIAGVVIAATAAIAIFGTIAVRHLRETPSSAPSSIRLSLSAPPAAELGSGEDTLDAAISPDERQIVFVATSNGTTRLRQRAIDSDRAESLPGTDGAQLPAWTQTGNVVSFFAGDRLKYVALPKGTVRDLAAVSAPSGASWLADGSLLFAPDARGPIRRLQNGTVSDVTTLRASDRAHVFPEAIQARDAFVYTALLNDGRRTIRLREGGNERDLVTTSGHGQVVADIVLHVRDGVLLAQRLDPETRALTGRALPLALDVGTASSGRSLFTASARLLISAPAATRLRQLTWFPLAGGPAGTIREPGNYWQVRLSPDERSAAVTQTTPLVRTLDIVVMPLTSTGNAVQVTRALAADSNPVWSPDGRSLAFRSLQDGRPHLYTQAVHDEGGDEAIVPMSEADETPTDRWNDRVIVHAPGAKGDLDLWTVEIESGDRAAAVSSGFNETDGRLSPDGRWVAYVSDESGQADIYAAPWPTGPRVRVSFAGGSRPRWGRDGRALFFQRGEQIMRADLMSASAFTTARPVLDVPGIRDFDVSRQRDAVLALMPAPASTTPSASVVVDWRSLIQ
jgi:eukaryotic-like serine/threonine-protein kinase